MTRRAKTLSLSPPAPTWTVWLWVSLAIPLLALLLAWISSGFQSLETWGVFVGSLLIAAGLLAAGWLVLRGEAPPRWLASLLVGAALLRLLAGILWYLALPVWGHGTPGEQLGYVMADAHTRDKAAWKLARSDMPLWSAFENNRRSDQYGGLLFTSALLYRYLGGDVHAPLMIVVITAAFSALAVVFTWAFARRAWGDGVGVMAAWILALYPEAILLGSSQMREAFTITFAILAFYGLLRFLQDRSRTAIILALSAPLLNLPFSPPLTALLLVMLALAGVVLAKNHLPGQMLRDRRLWLILAGVVALVIAGTWLSLRQFAPATASDPLAVISWWIRKSADYQLHLSKQASGWIQKIFQNTPEWTHVPMLVMYGVVKPFLVAALVDFSSAPILTWIQIWRAAGWILLLAFLLYAPVRAFGRQYGNSLAMVMSVIVWVGILAASYRGGGDLWDNPRYRAAFAGLQVALVAWAWVSQRQAPDPWLRRVVIGVASMLAWFVPWYLRRQYHLAWPVVDPFLTVALGLVTGLVIIAWDARRQSGRNKPPAGRDDSRKIGLDP